MEAQRHWDWQLNKDVLASNTYMLENELHCDISFTFRSEGSTISAHKYMLISRSPVFEAMFTGLARDQSENVVIEDVHREYFLEMLR